jgi:hypothetical protein
MHNFNNCKLLKECLILNIDFYYAEKFILTSNSTEKKCLKY